MEPSLIQLRVDRFLERVAAREPAPGGGAVSAVTVAAAAALTAMAARFSEELENRDHIVQRGEALRLQAQGLAEADARAYTAVLAAYRMTGDDPERRRTAIRSALEQATDVPMEVAGCAHEVGRLAVRLAQDGNPNLRGDAMTAVILAEAAARSALHLAKLNVELGALGPERLDRAAEWCAALREAVRSVEERT